VRKVPQFLRPGWLTHLRCPLAPSPVRSRLSERDTYRLSRISKAAGAGFAVAALVARETDCTEPRSCGVRIASSGGRCGVRALSALSTRQVGRLAGATNQLSIDPLKLQFTGGICCVRSTRSQLGVLAGWAAPRSVQPAPSAEPRRARSRRAVGFSTPAEKRLPGVDCRLIT
jgi:hypothetical protein